MSQSAKQPQSANLRSGVDAIAAETSDRKIELQRVGSHRTDSLLKRMLRAIFPDERRHERLLGPPLVCYLGSVRASRAYPLSDISVSGFRILTDECWTPGTEMPITLQELEPLEENNPACFTVQATVVRCGNDGVGFSIVLEEEDSNAAYGNPLQARWISKPEMQQFLNRLKEPPGPGAVDAVQSEGFRETSDAVQGGSGLKPAFLANQ